MGGIAQKRDVKPQSIGGEDSYNPRDAETHITYRIRGNIGGDWVGERGEGG
jgi:hypothetical protein